VRRGFRTSAGRGRLPLTLRITAGLLLFEGLYPIVAAPRFFELPRTILWAALPLSLLAVIVLLAERAFRSGALWWKTLAMGACLGAALTILAKLCLGGWWLGKLYVDPELPLRRALLLPWQQNDCLLHLAVLCWLAFGWWLIARTPRRAAARTRPARSGLPAPQ